MDNHTPTILINQLILVGHRKEYTIPFHPGVNIIYGDADTGKSSILDIINYMLGKSSLDLYDEIETSVNHCILDVELNGINYIIKREIHKPSKPLEVYQSTYREIEKAFPKKYKLRPEDNYECSGVYSDFLLNVLNLPNIKVKKSPSRDDSELLRLSFRDIFKYCYLNQDDVGSKRILNIGTFKETKTKQVFKYIHNLLDTNIADIEGEISYLKKDLNTKNEKYKSITEFLSDTQFSSLNQINQSYDSLEDEILNLKEQLEITKGSMISDSEKYHILKDILNSINLNVDKFSSEITNSEYLIEQYTRLKNDYLNDIDKLKSIEQSRNIIGHINETTSPCPICESEINTDKLKLKHGIDSDIKISSELTPLKRRIRELSSLVEKERHSHKQKTIELNEFLLEKDKARRLLDEESEHMITPYLSERDGLLSELSKLEERKKQFSHSLKVRSEQDKLANEVERISDRLGKANVKLTKQKEKAPTTDSITSKLEILLFKYLKKVNIKKCEGISINKSTFLPIVRNRDYKSITSGGLRTITSIGYFLSLHNNGISSDINLPRFLMIDTVGKYLGKTSTKDEYLSDTNKKEDALEDISDPAKYKNIFEEIYDFAKVSSDKGLTCQVILVDNDVPPDIQIQHAGFVVKHYSSNGANGLPIGLIDDIDSI
ncbi:MAG: hypothetical protein JKY50_13275 [Oleispira sp.]|nr:hypothetical protein [Oleispira sp.]MBL4880381.1 hypothetical protein [Oleispira sp.]